MSNPLANTIFGDRQKRIAIFSRLGAGSVTFGASKAESFAVRHLRKQNEVIKADESLWNAMRIAVQNERHACLEIASRYSPEAAAEIIARAPIPAYGEA